MSVLEIRGLTKTFPGVTALEDVSLSAEAGEIHGLVGENGAGKSTLVKILAGVHRPSAGSFLIDGVERNFSSPRDASQTVGVVHQERELVPHFTGWENLFLGLEPTYAGFLKKREMRATAKGFLETYGQGLGIDMDAPAHTLSSGQQEMLTIMKVLFRNPKIIIFDEPTAPLSMRECEILFALVRDLKRKGLAILYISHHLEEVLSLCDRISVLRNGRYVETVDAAATKEADLIRLMISRDMEEQYPKVPSRPGDIVFEAAGFSSPHGHLRNVSFAIRSGEIVGFAGLVGAGRTELAEAIFSGCSREAGTIRLSGEEFSPRSPKDSIRQGIVMIPENRREHGLLTQMSVYENLILPQLEGLSRMGFVRGKAAARHVVSAIGRLSIRAASHTQSVATLSGGNQQKVSVGKWFGLPAALWIFDEPTQGIDVDAKRELYDIMGHLAQQGAAVWFISSDLRELLAIADRLYVMKDRKIVGETRPPYDADAVLGMMMGETTA
jgi:ribose transport system ATP-binding protein